MENSKIEWTDHTANFWWGCFKVSPGCQNCYAETLSKRYGKNIWGPVKTTDREFKKGIWHELPKWNQQARREGRRHRVFVQSMADFFEDHPQVEGWRYKAVSLMANCEWLDFQILTKRPENANEMFLEIVAPSRLGWEDFPNIWIGTSVENQEMVEERIPHLIDIPAKVHFLSCEPLLGEITLRNWFLNDIEWVIVGGESGPKRRPFNSDWARLIRDECLDAGTPFFMKQIDKVQPIPADLMIREFPVNNYAASLQTLPPEVRGVAVEVDKAIERLP